TTTRAEILSAAAQHKLDAHDTSAALALLHELRQGPITDPIFQEKLKAVKGMLGVDVMTDGHDRYSNFLQAFIKPYLRLPENERMDALDTRNENSLISKALKGLRPTDEQLLLAHMTKRYGIDLGAGAPVGLPPVTPPRPAPPPAPSTSTRSINGIPVPAPLGGIAALQYNAKREQWRDLSTGKVYDKRGNEVNP